MLVEVLDYCRVQLLRAVAEGVAWIIASPTANDEWRMEKLQFELNWLATKQQNMQENVVLLNLCNILALLYDGIVLDSETMGQAVREGLDAWKEMEASQSARLLQLFIDLRETASRAFFAKYFSGKNDVSDEVIRKLGSHSFPERFIWGSKYLPMYSFSGICWAASSILLYRSLALHVISNAKLHMMSFV